MNTFTFLWYFLVAWIIILPLVTFLHELGHALTALALTNMEVTVILGKGNIKWQWGRLKFAVGWFSSIFGFTRYEGGTIKPYQTVLVALAGPLVSLFLAVLCWSLRPLWVEPEWVSVVMGMTATAAFVQFLFAIVPMRYPAWFLAYSGRFSDGARILHWLRVAREQPTSESDKRS